METPPNHDPGRSIATMNEAVLVEMPAVVVVGGVQAISTDPEISKLEACFNETSNHEVGLPDGYIRGAILLVSWEPDMDHLGVGEEVMKVKTLFEKDLHFTTQSLELHTRSSPDLQLDAGLSTFVRDHDGPHNLLVTYYAGHGTWKGGEGPKAHLLIHENNNTSKATGKPGKYQAAASWNEAEAHTLLRLGVEADVLSIFDCCFAFDIQRTMATCQRTFEILCASGYGQTTQQPGPNSFTSKFIEAMQELLDECKDQHPRSFDTSHLEQRIKRKRPDDPPSLGDRFEKVFGQVNSRHIRFAPIDPSESEAKKVLPVDEDAVIVTVHIGLEKQPTNDQVTKLAKKLSRVGKSKIFTKDDRMAFRRLWWGGLQKSGVRKQGYHYRTAEQVATNRWLKAIEFVKASKFLLNNSLNWQDMQVLQESLAQSGAAADSATGAPSAP